MSRNFNSWMPRMCLLIEKKKVYAADIIELALHILLIPCLKLCVDFYFYVTVIEIELRG